ncbi:MAG: hypothetical protein M1829_001835 [Trizodia sp. TS-e1964]|nr:MAG: hypothetical protein M1829_001835 [Trizodia sp. TS-e1964]
MPAKRSAKRKAHSTPYTPRAPPPTPVNPRTAIDLRTEAEAHLALATTRWTDAHAIAPHLRALAARALPRPVFPSNTPWRTLLAQGVVAFGQRVAAAAAAGAPVIDLLANWATHAALVLDVAWAFGNQEDCAHVQREARVLLCAVCDAACAEELSGAVERVRDVTEAALARAALDGPLWILELLESKTAGVFDALFPFLDRERGVWRLGDLEALSVTKMKRDASVVFAGEVPRMPDLESVKDQAALLFRKGYDLEQFDAVLREWDSAKYAKDRVYLDKTLGIRDRDFLRRVIDRWRELYSEALGGQEKMNAMKTRREQEEMKKVMELQQLCLLEQASKDSGVSRDELRQKLNAWSSKPIQVSEADEQAAKEYQEELDQLKFVAARHLSRSDEGEIAGAYNNNGNGKGKTGSKKVSFVPRVEHVRRQETQEKVYAGLRTNRMSWNTNMQGTCQTGANISSDIKPQRTPQTSRKHPRNEDMNGFRTNVKQSFSANPGSGEPNKGTYTLPIRTTARSGILKNKRETSISRIKKDDPNQYTEENITEFDNIAEEDFEEELSDEDLENREGGHMDKKRRTQRAPASDLAEADFVTATPGDTKVNTFAIELPQYKRGRRSQRDPLVLCHTESPIIDLDYLSFPSSVGYKWDEDDFRQALQQLKLAMGQCVETYFVDELKDSKTPEQKRQWWNKMEDKFVKYAEYVGVGCPDKPGLGWDELLVDPAQRKLLAYAILGKALETQVFGSLLWGALDSQEKALVALGESLRTADGKLLFLPPTLSISQANMRYPGFARHEIRSATVNKFLEGGQLPPKFLEASKRFSMQLYYLFCPLLDKSRGQSIVRSLYNVVLSAAMISVEMRRAKYLYHLIPAVKGEPFDFTTMHCLNRTAYENQRANGEHTLACLKLVRLSCFPQVLRFAEAREEDSWRGFRWVKIAPADVAVAHMPEKKPTNADTIPHLTKWLADTKGSWLGNALNSWMGY